MVHRTLHPWSVSPKQAIRIQEQLASEIELLWEDRPVDSVAGVDVSVRAGRARAAIVVLAYPALEPIEAATAEAELRFPYVPGLLTFREGPVTLAAWAQLTDRPDLVLFDGQGIAHPRGIGLAAHLGLWFDRPTIGVAKSRLYGVHAEPGPERGDVVPLVDERDPGRILGSVLRTRARVKPVFVSPGHRIDVAQATRYALSCCTRYRLPETTRWAHRVAGGETIGCG